jgi:pilus assembly protein CpaB
MPSSMRLTLVAVMLFAATAIGLYTYGDLNRKAPQIAQLAPMPPPTLYLTAGRQLPAGSLAREEDFATASGDMPAGAIVDTPTARASLRGALVRNFIDIGKPITATDVLRPRDRGFVATVLQPGSRAVSIGVDAISGVAGLVWPGDYVDVSLTHNLDQATSAAHRAVTENILTNVRVIATDQQIIQGASDATTVAGKLAQTVTLQVEPAQVERIAMAGHLGKLTLSIRSATERDSTQGPKSTYGGDVSPAIIREAGTTMKVIEGNDQHQVVFK